MDTFDPTASESAASGAAAASDRPTEDCELTLAGPTFSNGGDSTTQNVFEDHTLLLGVQKGDEQAIAALYDKYSGSVYSVALRILREVPLAEDVLQATFMEIWRCPAFFCVKAIDLSRTLVLISRQRAIEILRTKQPEDLPEMILCVASDPPKDDANPDLCRGKARAHVEELTAEQQEWLKMVVFEGKTLRDISAATGCAESLIKKGISSSLTSFRRA